MSRSSKTTKVLDKLPKTEKISKRSITPKGRVFITTELADLSMFFIYELIDGKYHFIQKAKSPLLLDKYIKWED